MWVIDHPVQDASLVAVWYLWAGLAPMVQDASLDAINRPLYVRHGSTAFLLYLWLLWPIARPWRQQWHFAAAALITAAIVVLPISWILRWLFF